MADRTVPCVRTHGGDCMKEANRRQADRVPVQVPVELDGHAGPLEARTADLSRTGARLRLDLATLGGWQGIDLSGAAALVREILPDTIGVRLHYKVLGPLLYRTITPTRISIPPDAPDHVELGCAFDRPLSLEETTSLGAPLPPVEGDAEEPLLRADQPAPHVREVAPPAPPPEPEAKREPQPEPDAPREDEPAELAPPVEEAWPEPEPEPEPEPAADVAPAPAPHFAGSAKYVYRAYLKADGRDGQPTLLGHSDQLNREAVRVRMARRGYEGCTVVEATVRFSERYGTAGGLKIMDGHKHLWTGKVRVCSIELPPDGKGDMLVTLAFERRLNPAELRRLGLASQAA